MRSKYASLDHKNTPFGQKCVLISSNENTFLYNYVFHFASFQFIAHYFHVELNSKPLLFYDPR